MTERMENQIERFAPGFRDCIIAKKVSPPAELERHNANLIGGNISGGSQEISQLFLRPTRRLYTTPAKGLYICSSSTPPGGVHGMCGYFAARAALAKIGFPFVCLLLKNFRRFRRRDARSRKREITRLNSQYKIKIFYVSPLTYK
jgi:hypothetical protein